MRVVARALLGSIAVRIRTSVSTVRRIRSPALGLVHAQIVPKGRPRHRYVLSRGYTHIVDLTNHLGVIRARRRVTSIVPQENISIMGRARRARLGRLAAMMRILVVAARRTRSPTLVRVHVSRALKARHPRSYAYISISRASCHLSIFLTNLVGARRAQRRVHNIVPLGTISIMDPARHVLLGRIVERTRRAVVPAQRTRSLALVLAHARAVLEARPHHPYVVPHRSCLES